MDKKTSLTGKEWWLHLMYWDPDKIKQVNLCDVWRIPFMVLMKAFVVLVICATTVCITSFAAVLFWVRPALESEVTNDAWKSLPFARIFGLRWGNFLLPIYMLFLCSGAAITADSSRVMILFYAIGVCSFIMMLLLIDSCGKQKKELETLQSGSLAGYLYRMGQLVWRGVTAAFKKDKTEAEKPKDESVGLLKVLKLRLKSFREKVCYSIPIVRD